MQSDGQSAAGGDDLINLYVPAGTYSLEVQDLGGAGTYSLTATAAPATSPFQPLPVGHLPARLAIVAGDFNGDGHLDLAVANYRRPTRVSVLLGNGDGTFQPQVTYAVGSQPGRHRGGRLHRRRPPRPGRRQQRRQRRVGAAGQRRRHVPAPGHLRGRVGPARHRGGRLQRRRPPRPGRRQRRRQHGVGAAGQRRRHLPAPGHLRGRDRARSPSWRATSTATASLDLAVANVGDNDGVGAAGQRRRHLPAPGHLRGRGRTRSRIVAGDFNGDGRLDLAVANERLQRRVGAAGQRRRHVPAPGHLRGRGASPIAIVAGDFNGDGRLDLAVANAGDNDVSVLLGNGDGTFQPQVTYAVGDRARRRSWRATSTATAASTWPSPTPATNTVSVLLGNGDGTFQPPSRHATRSGRARTPSWRATSTATAALDLAVANYGVDTRVGAAGQRRRHLPAPGHLRGRVEPSRASWRATSTATAGLDLAVANYGDNTVSVLLGNGDGTFQPQVTYAVGIDPRRDRGGRLQRRRPHSTWPSPTTATTRCRCCWATATAPSSPRSPTRSGSSPDAIVAGDFNGDGRLDLAVANDGDNDGVGAAGQRRRHLPAPGHLRGRDRTRRASWRATSTATAGSTWPSPTGIDERHVSVLLGNGDGTFQPQVTYAVGIGPRRHRGGRLQRRRPPRPGRRQRRSTTPCRCCWATATAPSSPRSPTRSGSDPDAHRGGRLQRRRPARPGRRQRRRPTTCRCCWATATARSPTPASSPPPLMPRPWWPTSTATAPTMSWSSTGPATSSIARASPASPARSSRPSRSTPAIPSRDIAWVPEHRSRARCSPASTPTTTPSRSTPSATAASSGVGSLATGQLPAQIIAADLNGDGLDDLVVRNAGDGTLSVFFGSHVQRSRRSRARLRRRSCPP